MEGDSMSDLINAAPALRALWLPELLGEAAESNHWLTLVVIDPLAAFLPGRDENNAAAILAALLPLRRLTAAGIAVLLLHHTRKAAGRDGLLSRGSGALGSHADVLIEMSWCGTAAADRRRRLRAFARFTETPAERLIELNVDGTDYVSLGDADDVAFAHDWPGVLMVLTQARGK